MVPTSSREICLGAAATDESVRAGRAGRVGPLKRTDCDTWLGTEADSAEFGAGGVSVEIGVSAPIRSGRIRVIQCVDGLAKSTRMTHPQRRS